MTGVLSPCSCNGAPSCCRLHAEARRVHDGIMMTTTTMTSRRPLQRRLWNNSGSRCREGGRTTCRGIAIIAPAVDKIHMPESFAPRCVAIGRGGDCQVRERHMCSVASRVASLPGPHPAMQHPSPYTTMYAAEPQPCLSLQAAWPNSRPQQDSR